MAQLLVPVMGQQQFDAVSYVHDLVVVTARDAFTEGFVKGQQAGQAEGYQEGIRDTQNIVGAQAAGAYNAGYDEGYDDGLNGPTPPVSQVYQAGYDAGHLAGWDAAIDDDDFGVYEGDISEAIENVTPTNTPFMSVKKNKIN